MKSHTTIKLLLPVLFLALSSCDNSSSAAKNFQDPNAPRTPDSTEYDRPLLDRCIPESKLLARGIIGGRRVYNGDANEKKAIMILSNAELCTASAIAPNVLLTAAHCIKGSKDKIEIVYNVSVSCESGYTPDQHRGFSVDAVVHQSYNEISQVRMSSNDVALVFLRDNIPYGYPVYKIADPADLQSNTKLRFVGYGVTASEGAGSGIMRTTEFTREAYTVLYNENKVEVDQDSGTGICSGDSGGPGLVEINGIDQVLGVNSYVMGPKSDYCGGKSFLELAHHYKPWINQQLQARGYRSIE